MPSPMHSSHHHNVTPESSSAARSDRHFASTISRPDVREPNYSGGRPNVEVPTHADTSDRLRFRRRRGHASSSFRLESPLDLNVVGVRRSYTATSTRPEEQDGQGKSWSPQAGKHSREDRDLFVQKRRRHGTASAGRFAPGGFPLAQSVVTGGSPSAGSGRDAAGLSPLPGDGDDGAGGPHAGTRSSSAAAPRSPGNARDGFDEDTVQIVNLALSLSESRRRATVGRSLTNAGLRDRRLSSAHRTSPAAKQSEPSWRDLVQSPREPSSARQRRITSSPQVSDTAPDDSIYEFSDATLARAEKARKHFELFAEYLRLLPHLPPLRASPIARKSAEPEQDHEPGRVYNPLQYIRNRKIRFREKSAINTEVCGWEDVDRVHRWVDDIVTSRETTGYEPDEYVRLPPIKPESDEQRNSIGALSPLSPSSSRPADDSNRPKRPRIDWIFTPAELLADAAWLEEDSNKLRIEDRDGNKIYPSETEFRVVSLPGSLAHRPETPPEEEQEVQRDHTSQQPEPLPSFISIASQSSHGVPRGRRRHRFSHSVSLSPSPSHVRKSSKSRWHRALARSRSSSTSSSSSSSSDSEDGGWKRRLTKWYNQADEETEQTQYLAVPGTQSPMDYKRRDKPLAPCEGSLGPLQDYRTAGLKIPSHRHTHSVASSASDNNGPASRQLSAADSGSDPNLSAQAPCFPSIAINLSPPRTRSSSPSKNPLQHGLKPAKGGEQQSLQDHGAQEQGAVPLDFSPARRPLSREERSRAYDIRRLESLPTKLRRGASHQESKIRGMFKGGRIAELVGNEVSKVGDFIRKKDGPAHSRSSSLSSALSEYAAGEDGGKGKGRLHLIKTTSDTGGHGSNGPFTTPLDGPPEAADAPGADRPSSFDHPHAAQPANNGSGSVNQFKDTLKPGEPSEARKVVFRSTSRDRQPEMESGPSSAPPEQHSSRPQLTEATRHWSMSSRSITKLAESSRVDKREIAAVRAHLLSSGTKALQICRTARTPVCAAATPNDFSGSHLSTVTSREAVMVARSLMATFDSRTSDLRRSMITLSHDTVPSLVSDLERLETLITSNLTPRMRAMAAEADQLTGELTTTGTLAVKQLNDALDKSIRKRNRRFRRLSRLGFVLLEWFLVGAMWFAWMIVMTFKVVRGVWRGAISGIRWILWL
ncbi:hypothetical protein VTO42DRAFT_4920 [Malbranchea cinnamomea]